MYDLLVGSMHNDDLSALMNGPIRKKLGIIPSHVTWGGMYDMKLTAGTRELIPYKTYISDFSYSMLKIS